MIIGTGIDIVEIQRVKQLLERQPRFCGKILSPKEHAYWKGLKERRRVEFLAGRFAAKEALSKALGTGIGKHLSWKDVSILPGKNGAPTVTIHKELPLAELPLLELPLADLPLLKEKERHFYIHLSISHSREYAVAQVIVEAKEKRLTP